MKILSIDIGNTSTHCGVVDGKTVLQEQKIPTAQIGQILPSLLIKTDYDGIAYCSVVPDATQVLLPIVRQQPKPQFHLHHDNCPGIAINYPKPEEIGQDRLANAIAAQTYFGTPAIVIDMGTAVNFDIVSSKGYEGGILAPGLEIMTRYLHDQTALLPQLDPNDLITDERIGKSTITAMKLGCAVGFSGMISALLKTVLDEFEKQQEYNATLIGSGGSGGKLLKETVPDIILEPNMVLLGLAEAFRRGMERDSLITE